MRQVRLDGQPRSVAPIISNTRGAPRSRREEEIHDMKDRKRAGRIAAAVVASLVLAFSVAAPASAAGVYVLYCPSNMQGRVAFTSTVAGSIEWMPVYPSAWTATHSTWYGAFKQSHVYYAPHAGRVGIAFLPDSDKRIYDVYATCVF